MTSAETVFCWSGDDSRLRLYRSRAALQHISSESEKRFGARFLVKFRLNRDGWWCILSG